MNIMELLQKHSNKSVEELKKQILDNNRKESMRLPQIEPNPFSNKNQPTSMEVFNRLDKKHLELNILPQTHFYLENFQRLLSNQENNYSTDEIIDLIVVYLYNSLKSFS